MTAILVAGRSGSAFAAEIGTMKVNEEVDALVTMGFDPVRFLAVPKVLAAMMVVPVLTIYAMFFGLLGGLIIGVLGLDLTVYSYVQETQRSIELFRSRLQPDQVGGLCPAHGRASAASEASRCRAAPRRWARPPLRRWWPASFSSSSPTRLLPWSCTISGKDLLNRLKRARNPGKL